MKLLPNQKLTIQLFSIPAIILVVLLAVGNGWLNYFWKTIDPGEDSFGRLMYRLAGPGVLNCGSVEIGCVIGAPDAMQAGTCAAKALKARKAFVVRYDYHPFSAEPQTRFEALVVTRHGEAYFLTQKPPIAVQVKRCEKPEINLSHGYPELICR